MCDILIGDGINCLATPNWADCLSAGVGIIPVGKLLSGGVKLSTKLPKAFNKGDGCLTGNSFVPGTLVLMADGARTPIEEVRVGDLVLAKDLTTGESGPRLVNALIVGGGGKSLVEITVHVNGKRDVDARSVIATDGHPFWVPRLERWVTATQLRVGMLLQTSAGTYVQVSALKKWTAPGTVHNLTVAHSHTYYVYAGNVSLFVHNCDRKGLNFSDAERNRVYDNNLNKNNGVIRCEYCGRDVLRRPRGQQGAPDDAQIDHVDPKSKGGCGAAHNGCVACRTCNRDKSTKTLSDWDDELREFLN
ncbi:polymorphic toxin-type HINT domain-containing protein [Sphaerisporangium sp. TRM90804]|uniref:polymorphic toxin-type HINT domain-containing protein n=1 Tax=Sphaerisporangium sp. TRM90804 TaxID=3031113 RepID=UPI00244D4D24|nr:polymorphic toxin-type HINT domain-containing protein [Sphaerisporangium sp. TRM90804]MDH2423935.1 polymorphic toxin-type HINT domain-containing protein [Sphaerisporangium sp. TRM90804]